MNPTRIDTQPVTVDLFGDQLSARVIGEGVDFEYHSCSNSFRFVEATDGSHLVLDPRPRPEAMSTIYPPNYEPYHFDSLPRLVRWFRDRQQKSKAQLIHRLVGNHGRILDVGCGGGALLRSLAEIRGSKAGLAGSDFDGPHLDALASAGFEIYRATMPPPGTDLFDAVIMLQVVEHLDDPGSVLEQLAGRMRPGSTLLIETPSADGLDARLFKSRYWGGYHFPRHFWILRDESLRRLVRDAGFVDIVVSYLPAPAFWIQSVHHRTSESPLARLAFLFSIRNPILLALATAIDLVRIATKRPTSCLRVIARLS